MGHQHGLHYLLAGGFACNLNCLEYLPLLAERTVAGIIMRSFVFWQVGLIQNLLLLKDDSEIKMSLCAAFSTCRIEACGTFPLLASSHSTYLLYRVNDTYVTSPWAPSFGTWGCLTSDASWSLSLLINPRHGIRTPLVA